MKSLLFILFLLPNLAFASSGSDFSDLPFFLFMEAFVSIHMSLFVLLPISKLINDKDYKKVFLILFVIRALILLIFDFFITPFIAIFDFFLVFIGAFLIVPLLSFIVSKKRGVPFVNAFLGTPVKSNDSLNETFTKKTCLKCGALLEDNFKFCKNCGSSVADDKILKITDFDPMFSLSDDKFLEEVIKKEFVKNNIDDKRRLIPYDVLKRKKIMTIIFSCLLFIYNCSIFFHFPVWYYLIGLVSLIVFFIFTRKYNFIKYLKKQIKARPSEKISNIVLSYKEKLTYYKTFNILLPSLLVSIVAPLLIFMNPRIFYEKVDNGYAVRYYAFGVTNFESVIIPDTYNGEKVVSLRGNAFSNMLFLKSVKLSNNITEIRGEAFLNDINLKEVKLPDNLEYLGGGAFENCISLNYVKIPQSVNYIGGEAFKNDIILTSVVLPENITEIRGNTFENCKSLTSINIPSNVVRIGGHAFYGCESLSKVLINYDSKLLEIGSSAFRNCSSLYNITLPKGVSINQRSFKNSPTVINYFNK